MKTIPQYCPKCNRVTKHSTCMSPLGRRVNRCTECADKFRKCKVKVCKNLLPENVAREAEEDGIPYACDYHSRQEEAAELAALEEKEKDRLVKTDHCEVCGKETIQFRPFKWHSFICIEPGHLAKKYLRKQPPKADKGEKDSESGDEIGFQVFNSTGDLLAYLNKFPQKRIADTSKAQPLIVDKGKAAKRIDPKGKKKSPEPYDESRLHLLNNAEDPYGRFDPK